MASIIICILVVIIVLLVGALLWALSRDIDLDKKITNTERMLTLIDTLVDVEIMNRVKTIVYLPSGRYDVRNLDTDVKAISVAVYDGLQSAVYLMYPRQMLIQSDYIMAYITKRTTARLLDSMTQFNDAKAV